MGDPFSPLCLGGSISFCFYTTGAHTDVQSVRSFLGIGPTSSIQSTIRYPRAGSLYCYVAFASSDDNQRAIRTPEFVGVAIGAIEIDGVVTLVCARSIGAKRAILPRRVQVAALACCRLLQFDRDGAQTRSKHSPLEVYLHRAHPYTGKVAFFATA